MINYLLKISCPDQPGIISMITTAISECNGNIVDLDQHTDTNTKKFFLRTMFSIEKDQIKKLTPILESIESIYQMKWLLQEANTKKRVLILCSKKPHCLIHLLEKKRQEALNIEIPCIISNHNDCAHIAKHHGIEYIHLPITSENKQTQERKITEIIQSKNIDITVLARYMQILSEEFCSAHDGKIINIHHSFLPGFKGANPYKQAFDRGVKIIGATSHFVTKDLDEGPIICQETIEANHHHSVDDLTRFGADIEAIVLARALEKICQDKVFIDNKKTIVFQ